jgi:hypothetical protein
MTVNCNTKKAERESDLIVRITSKLNYIPGQKQLMHLRAKILQAILVSKSDEQP